MIDAENLLLSTLSGSSPQVQFEISSAGMKRNPNMVDEVGSAIQSIIM